MCAIVSTDPRNGPIFVIGANRSGTTLLRLMLNAHSRIAVPEELLYFRSEYGGVSVKQWAAPGLSEAAFTKLAREFVDNVVALHPELDRDELLRSILDCPDRSLRQPYETVLNQWVRLQGKARWGEKTPGNLFYVDVLVDMFPDATFLYVVRDPRAGVASMQRADFFPEDAIFNALTRRKHACVGMDLLHRHVAPDRWTTIRYEDLVTFPEATLRHVCSVVGERYEPQMLQYHQNAESYMKAKAVSTFNATATQPVTTRKMDAWRGVLTLDQVAVVERICGEEMDTHGYDAIHPRLPVGRRLLTALESSLKVCYWHIQNWRHRHIRHYTVRSRIFARSRGRLATLRRVCKQAGQKVAALLSIERFFGSGSSEAVRAGDTDNGPLSEPPPDDDPKVRRGVARNRPNAPRRHVG